ncbi:DNA mismatch repair protein MSH3 [Entomortierella parvispora]|uniref:DNA mismatch repair protein n=1 Tax=Entomortierella parvispora TaxID=205924 RepID=A0A9P3LS03_9FUNG|nr:DNA mismatch repair protein MSH3 [Entomortierella parvispora]
MAADKRAPVKAQSTLLSFFKPAVATPTTQDSKATPPSKDKNVAPLSESEPTVKAPTPGNSKSPTSSRTTGNRAEKETLSKTKSRDEDDESEDEQDAMEETRSKDSSSTLPKAAAKGMLSRLQYESESTESSTPDNSGDTPTAQKPTASNGSSSLSRQEAFRQKIRQSGASSQATPSHADPTTPTTKRRRLIVSEDEDEDDDEYKESAQPVVKRAATTPTRPIQTKGGSSRSSKAKSIYTPLEQQYLEIKEQYPDAILCIEVGYKFRFFGNDAEIASKELSIMHFMDHNFFTASIPVHRLDVHVRRLVHSGYKVGVVRQIETAALKSAGDNKSAPFTRKLTNLYTKATFIESLDRDEDQFGGHEPSSQYIMSISEQPQGGSGADERVLVAIMAVQPATGDIIYDEFIDGHFRNELETRLLHIQPTELIVPMEPMSKATEKIIKHLSSSRRTAAVTSSPDDVRIERTNGFLKYDKAFTLVSEFYAEGVKEEQLASGSSGSKTGSNKSQAEVLLTTVLGLSKNLIVVLAAMISHLSDFGLAPVFRLSKYFECFTSRSHMLLNGNTIANLEIYRNQTDWSSRGSLFSILDHTVTGFGKRLLKKWVGKPLVDRIALQERIDAVEEILSTKGTNIHLENTRSMLKGLMDLEKGVCRVHYGKSTPKEFLTILKAFTQVAKVTERADRTEQDQDYGLSSPILRRLVGSMSKAKEDTEYFVQCLDDNAAFKNDKLQMFRTETLAEKWPEVLEHKDNIVQTDAELQEHLIEIRKTLREPRLEFTSVSGIDYLVEVKNKDVAKIPKAWIKISGTKQVSRFHTPETTRLVNEKAQHQERLVLSCEQAFKAFQQEFSDRYEIFRDVVQSLAILDCLFSLATVACLPNYVKPEYVDNGGTHTTIDIKNGRHPMVEQLVSPGTFVPNDVHFGLHPETQVAETSILLTGPNMGGKSCYIRQVALLCIMAQIGSYLPADSARVSMLDAVYTRMGASDNIFGHESTFMVELQETSDILKMATSKSLVILDELGRGTSTLDGVAIAYAVLRHVVSSVRATTLFVTHYPSLSEVATEFAEGTIRNFHMGFMASSSAGSSSSADRSPSEVQTESPDDDIVFLYKITPGVSLKSYGLNVARMAKLPQKLIDRARTKSKDLEHMLEQRILKKRKRQQDGEDEDDQTHNGPDTITDQQAKLVQRIKQIYACSSLDQAAALQHDLEGITAG